jgi:hypothetical protein
MSQSVWDRSVFYKIATKEDDYTQLLCNLMQRPEGASLRIKVLSLLLDPELASIVAPNQIDTQVVITDAGRPDLIVESPEVRAAIEVKVNPHRRCTDYQVPSDDDSVEGYCGFLNRATASRKILSFLVPRDWEFLPRTQDRLKSLHERNPSIETKIVFWERVLELSKDFLSDPLHVEFWRLLESDFGSVKFEEEEIEVAVNCPGLPIATIIKVGYVIDQIAEKCRKEFSIDGPEHAKSGEQYGLEFYRVQRGSRGREKTYFFWFGIWSPYWEKEGRALCFGITNEKEAEKKAFERTYSGATEPFRDYTLGWVSEADFMSDASGSDPATKIWKWLKPVLDAVYAAAK